MSTADENLDIYEDNDYENDSFEDDDFNVDEEYDKDISDEEFEKQAKEALEFFNDVIYIAGGVDDDGIPNSSAALAIDVIGESGDIETKENFMIGEGELNFFHSGGCMVVTADFKKRATVEFNGMMNVCSKWFENYRQNEVPYGEEAKESITFTVFPKLLEGTHVIVLSGLAFYMGFDSENGKRLVMCFDNVLTKIVPVDVDYKGMLKDAEEEVRAEEEALENEFFALKEEEEKINNEYFTETIKSYYRDGSDIMNADPDKYYDDDGEDSEYDDDYDDEEDEDDDNTSKRSSMIRFTD